MIVQTLANGSNEGFCISTCKFIRTVLGLNGLLLAVTSGALGVSTSHSSWLDTLRLKHIGIEALRNFRV